MVTQKHAVAFKIRRLAKHAIRAMIVRDLGRYGSVEALAKAAGWNRTVVARYLKAAPVPDMDGEAVADPHIDEIKGRSPAVFEREICFALARAAYSVLEPVLSLRQIGRFVGYDERNIGRAVYGSGGKDTGEGFSG